MRVLGQTICFLGGMGLSTFLIMNDHPNFAVFVGICAALVLL